MWIAPEYRKKGFATKLASKALGYLKENGALEVRLWNVNTNKGAKKLYESLGFQKTSIQKPLESNPNLSITQFVLRF